MPEFDDPFGLASLWDIEEANATLDEVRENARMDRAQKFFGDAIRNKGEIARIDVTVTALAGVIHVKQIGLNWISGVRCSRPELLVVPFDSIESIRDSRACECTAPLPEILEFVTLGALLRRWERRSTHVTMVTLRGGVLGRVSGVFRDAVELHNRDGRTLFAFRQLQLMVESGIGGA